MPRQALLVPLAALGLALAGCDPAVQARYHPTSVDEVFGSFSHVSGVEGEVYELPNTPPALVETDARSRSCLPPGLVHKPISLVGLREDPHSYRTLEPTAFVAMEEPGLPSPRPGKAYAMYGWQPATTTGAKEPISEPPYSPDLQPGRSIYRGEPTPLGSYRRDTYSWCDDDANLR